MKPESKTRDVGPSPSGERCEPHPGRQKGGSKSWREPAQVNLLQTEEGSVLGEGADPHLVRGS